MGKKSKKSKKSVKKIGLPPGTLIYTGNERQQPTAFELILYDESNVKESPDVYLTNLLDKVDASKNNWLNITGLNNIELIDQVGKHFSLHPLLLEDILNASHLPKGEGYDQYFFLTLKMLSINPSTGEIEQEHISFVLGDNYLLSFQEKKGDIFDGIRDRIIHAKGRVRRKKVDYLLYLLIDTIVDHYYLILDDLGERIGKLEDQFIENEPDVSLEDIYRLKQRMILVRKAIFPLRDAVGRMVKEDSGLFDPLNIKYFNDVHDHLKHNIELFNAFYEMLSGLKDLYISNLNNNMNSVMKTLTVIATIFIPLTFIAGLYGMNFKNMPELEWPGGYPLVLGIMLFIGILMFYYIKKKKWL